MLAFDPLVTFLHIAVFIAGMILFDRLVLLPVYRILDRRREWTDPDTGRPVAARRLRDELAERYQRATDEAHRRGTALLIETQEKAHREAREHIEQIRRETADMVEQRKREMRDLRLCVTEDVERHRDEMVALIEEKLWSEKAA